MRSLPLCRSSPSPFYSLSTSLVQGCEREGEADYIRAVTELEKGSYIRAGEAVPWNMRQWKREWERRAIHVRAAYTPIYSILIPTSRLYTYTKHTSIDTCI